MRQQFNAFPKHVCRLDGCEALERQPEARGVDDQGHAFCVRSLGRNEFLFIGSASHWRQLMAQLYAIETTRD